MTPKIPIMGSHAVGKDRLNGTESEEALNRQINISRAVQLRRLHFVVPEVGDIDLDATDVLCEGVSFRKQLEVCARDGVAASLTIGLSKNGEENGHDYHGARGGRSAWPIIRDDGIRVRKATNDVIREAIDLGVEVWGVELGNEESYQPSLEVSWAQFESAYISTLRKVESKVRSMLGPDVWVISGGQSSQDRLHGHTSINKAIIDAGLGDRIVGCYHGNNEPDAFFEAGIIELFAMGFKDVVVNEDKPNQNGASRIKDRAIIAHRRGCIACALFDCRHVNYNGQNGCIPCSWRVGGGCSAPREKLSVIGCNDFNPDRWDELREAAEWNGSWMGGSDPLLPWIVENGNGNGDKDPLEPLANLYRRTAELAGAPKPKVSDLLEDDAWRKFARKMFPDA